MTSTASESFSPIHRLLRWRQEHLVDPTDRVAVLTNVDEAGAFGPRYAFMTLLSCGIATLGLLQNSAAVIIGAMLIAPLMGPIIELGMGLATFDFRTVRSALGTLLLGIVLGLAVAMLIVWASPLKQATPEILSRTQPTFFDLLVAVFSGLAGAYATITRKGETIVGVAIATALMPPLAVIGYGVVAGNNSITWGATLLLLTNLLAIALSATIMARLYGFGGQDTPKQTLLQAVLIVGTFALLSLPLGISLKKITVQTQSEMIIRSALETAAREAKGRISALRVENAQGMWAVDAVLMTPRLVNGLDAELSRSLSEQLGRKVDVQLREVLTADNDTITQQQSTLLELTRAVRGLEQAESGRAAEQRSRQEALGQAAIAIVTRLGALESSPNADVLRWRLNADMPMALQRTRDWEAQINAAREPTQVPLQILPPLQTLPPLDMADEGNAVALATQIWALQRWQVSVVDAWISATDQDSADVRLAQLRQQLQKAGITLRDAQIVTSAQRRTYALPAQAVWLRLPSADAEAPATPASSTQKPAPKAAAAS